MATNIAARRGAKAQRRKAVVAQKRKVDVASNSLATKVQRAAELPIQHCLLGTTLASQGIGTLVVARGATPHRMWVAGFLLDTYALGVKNTFFHELDGAAFEAQMAHIQAANGMASVDPACARKLLRDLARWSASIGYGPHEDFSVIERIFGSVRGDDCTEEFTFGHDGKPLLIPGPNDSLGNLRQRRTETNRHVESMAERA